jgi:hypothetical protein
MRAKSIENGQEGARGSLAAGNPGIFFRHFLSDFEGFATCVLGPRKKVRFFSQQNGNMAESDRSAHHHMKLRARARYGGRARSMSDGVDDGGGDGSTLPKLT